MAGIRCTLAFIFHLAVFITELVALDKDLRIGTEDFPHKRTYGGRLKFLTFWCLIIQTVYYGLCLINDVFGSNVRPSQNLKNRSSLQKFRDFFYASVVFPIGVFVVLTFWGIYAVDRELVFPKALDAFIPSWLNHVMHTTVLPFLLVEKYLVYHDYPSRSKGLLACIGMVGLYQLWVLWIAHHAGIWVYPIMQVLDWQGRTGFFLACWVVIIVIYITGEKLSTAIWGMSPGKLRAQKIQ